MSRVSTSLFLSILLLATLPLASQQSPEPGVPTLHVTARTVILDVVVTDDNGNPVTGLQPSAFTLLEDGVPQKLSSFEEHGTSTTPPAVPVRPLPTNTFAVRPPPPESITKTLIVLDQLHYPTYPFLRADILAFMRSLPPGHPIGIVRLDWQGLHLIQNFTSDPQTLQQVVAGKAILPPPPALDVHEWTGCEIPYRGVTNPYGRLARFLDGVPGRINLAWVTDAGEPDSFLGQEYSQLNAFTHDLSASVNGFRLGRVSFFAIKAGGYIGGSLLPDDAPDIPVPQIIPLAVSHMPVQPIDCPLMPPAQGSLLSNQALADAATAVGGHAYFNGATDALNKIQAVGANYYTLSYVPSNPNWNGAYRKINIGIPNLPKTDKPAFGQTDYKQQKIVYRPGYYARSRPGRMIDAGSTAFGLEVTPQPVQAMPAATPRTPPAFEAAMGFGALPASQVDFTIAAEPSPRIEIATPIVASTKPSAGQDNFVPGQVRNYRIHYWVDPSRLSFSRTANGSYRDDLRFAAIVYGDDGQGVNLVSASTHLEVPADDLEMILTSGVTFTQTIAVPIPRDGIQDRLFIRTGVMELSTGHIGVIEVPADQISIPPAPPLTAASQKPPQQ
jgi:VWFA-related protein